MIVANAFSGKHVIVLGMGRTGTAATEALRLGGTTVLPWDDNNHSDQMQHPATYDWTQIAALVLSPGIPTTHPLVQKAISEKADIISDIDLLYMSHPNAKYVGITGTNGKTTTTSLLGHILKTSGSRHQVGGNIGTPVLAMQPLVKDEICVLEMSSYQLDISHHVLFDVAVLLNISPDHLERHGGMDRYIKAKQKIFQQANQLAIVGLDDPHCREIFAALECDKIGISSCQRIEGGIYIQNNNLVDDAFESHKIIADLTTIGIQNWQNMTAAYAAARHLGLQTKSIIDSLSTFRTPPHRQEVVAKINDITYVNDSKATNVAATKFALANYNDIFWILGGRSKGDDLEELIPHLSRVKHAFLIGDAAPQLASCLDGHVPCTISKTLEVAFSAANAMAKNHSTILLSPACASFDQFKNFEHRGDTFRNLVTAQKGAA